MKKEQTYPVEALLKSKRFSGYQIDFARAILTKGEYTIAEAEKALQDYFKKEAK